MKSEGRKAPVAANLLAKLKAMAEAQGKSGSREVGKSNVGKCARSRQFIGEAQSDGRGAREVGKSGSRTSESVPVVANLLAKLEATAEAQRESRSRKVERRKAPIAANLLAKLKSHGRGTKEARTPARQHDKGANRRLTV